MRYVLIVGVVAAGLGATAFASEPPKPITVTVNPSVKVTGGAQINASFQAGSVKAGESVGTKTSVVVGASLSASAGGFTTP
jgi:hypothetical protein